MILYDKIHLHLFSMFLLVLEINKYTKQQQTIFADIKF